MSGTIESWEQNRFWREAQAGLAAVEVVDLPDAFEDPRDFEPNETIVLAERHYGHLHVELRWNRVLDVVSVTLRDGDDGRLQGAVIPHEKAMDAFAHPFCYV